MDDLTNLFNDKDLEHSHVKEIVRPERDKQLKFQLYPHQIRGAEWMIIRERYPIRAVRGGLVLDDTGLGKTLQTLTLPLNDYINEFDSLTLVVCPAHLVRIWYQEIQTHFTNDVKITSVLYHGKNRNVLELERQIDYREGPVVVITSFATLSSIWKNRPGLHSDRDVYDSFFSRQWDRIVLDEAHHIRNAKTDVSQSVRHLHGQYLWVLTATPVMNTVDDLFALLNFLRAKPFIGPQAKRIWARFIKRSAFHNMEQLRLLLSSMAIRRTKQNVLKLPDLERKVVHLKLGKWQRDIYNAIREYSQTRADHLMNRMKTLQKAKRNLNSTSALDPNEASKLIKHTLSCALTQILRLKQCAVCPILCLQKIRWIKREFAKESLEQLNPITRDQLLKRLQELKRSPDNECPICFDDEADFISDPCGHCCCEKCWGTIMKTTPNCPICRAKIITVSPMVLYASQQDMEIELFEDLPFHAMKPGLIHQDPHNSNPCLQDSLINQGQKSETLPPADVVSAKISWILNFLKQRMKLGSAASAEYGKIVITSQWVTLLNLLSQYLVSEGLFIPDKTMLTIYGTSSAEDREKMVKKFQENDDIQILLLSLIAGGEGITITEGSCIVMMDRWWNEQSEYQAISRLYRIGQRRDVQVLTLHSDETIEDQIDEIIAYKGMIAESLVSTNVTKIIKADEWMQRLQICLRSPDQQESPDNQLRSSNQVKQQNKRARKETISTPVSEKVSQHVLKCVNHEPILLSMDVS